MLRIMLKSALLISTIMATIVPAKAVEVYIFRGAGDASFISKRLSFSQGMDDLGDEIKAQGIFAEVYRWENGIGALNEIRRRKPKSVALLGHSMGALTSMSLAATLQKEGIKVSYMGLIDIPGPVGHVPSEVAIAENYYSLFPVYGMLPIPARHQGEISNKYVFGQIHTTMDNSRKIHDAMMAAIWQIDDVDRGIREPVTLRAYTDHSTGTGQTAEGSLEAQTLPGTLRPIE